MTYLSILCVLTSAQIYSQVQASQEEIGTLIQNKNINVIVNVNAEEIAKELWKVIEVRLNNRTHITSSKGAIKELKNAVIPLVSPTRRGEARSAFQVASQLDKITRRALTRDTPNRDLLDEEIMTRDIVADMMTSLKIILSRTVQSKIDELDASSRRTIHGPVKINDDEKDDYVNVRIKILRKDIFDAIQ